MSSTALLTIPGAIILYGTFASWLDRFSITMPLVLRHESIASHQAVRTFHLGVVRPAGSRLFQEVAQAKVKFETRRQSIAVSVSMRAIR